MTSLLVFCIFVVMILSKNNTRTVALKGYIVRQDPNREGYLYVDPDATTALGVLIDEKRIAQSGEEALVYVNGFVKKGQTIRSFKYGDSGKSGQGFALADNYTYQYLQMGTSLESGRNKLIKTSLNIKNSIAVDSTLYQPLDSDLTRLADYRRIGGDTSYAQFEADGTIQFVGDATVWDDLRIIPNVFDVPGLTDPDIISYQPGGSGATFKVYAFAKGDEGFFTVQIPHSYKVGSDMKAHVHWTPGPRGNEENGNVVQWRLDYSFATINGNFGASQTLSLADACDGTDHKHQMTPEATISGVGLGISSQMWGRIYRWNDASDTWIGTGANLPIFIEFDMHFEIDTIGSRTSSSK